MAKSKLRTTEGLFLPPANMGEVEPRGLWGQAAWCAGIAPKHKNYLRDMTVYAGINIGYVSDFCGGRIIGCIAVRSSEVLPAHRKYLPEMPPVPDKIANKYLSLCPYENEESIWPVLGAFHYLVANGIWTNGAAQLTLFDRTTGLTMTRTRAAMSLLTGRVLGTASRDYNERRSTIISSRMGRPYRNYNSGHQVASMQINIRQCSSPLPESVIQQVLPEEGFRLHEATYPQS